MPSRFASFVALAFAASTITVRAAEVPADAQKAIAADYQLNCTAAINPTDANLAVAFGLLAPTFVDVDVKGQKHPRDQVVSTAQAQMKQVHTEVCDPTIESQTLNSDGSITAIAAVHVAGTVSTPNGDHQLDLSTRSQDTWQNVKGTWLETQSQELHTTAKVDGHVVEDEGQPGA